MKNMGSIDRRIRLALGIILIVAAVIFQLQVGRYWGIGVLGLVFVVTSSIGMCPLYLPFKFTTIRKSK